MIDNRPPMDATGGAEEEVTTPPKGGGGRPAPEPQGAPRGYKQYLSLMIFRRTVYGMAVCVIRILCRR